MENKPSSYFMFIRLLLSAIGCLILIPIVTFKEMGYYSILVAIVISGVLLAISLFSLKRYKLWKKEKEDKTK